MAATLSRHHGNYARPQKTLPITMPAKTAPTYSHPVSRVALEAPELSDTSTIYSSRYSGGTLSTVSDDYESARYGEYDPYDELQTRISNLDLMPADRIVAKQAQESGRLNAKQRESEDMLAKLRQRRKQMQADCDETSQMVSEARADAAHIRKQSAANKAKIVRIQEAATESRRSRPTRR